MKRIVVFCGSASGTSPVYPEAAIGLGKALVANGYGLVYGGARIGLMGALADAVLQAGGEVIGVLPDFLGSREIAHAGLTRLIRVQTMHERKQIMSDLSDAVIAMPGGFGTLDELFEMLTWAQLDLHQKPIGLLNIEGYFDALLQCIQTMTDTGFVRPAHQNLLKVAELPHELITLLKGNGMKP